MPLALETWLAFAALCVGLVLTPGPNMVYLVSRSLSQGWRAGGISLAGTAAGFVVFVLSAAFGLTAIALAVPFVYEAIKFAGAAYLLWLAWPSVKPGGASPFVTRHLPYAGARRLFMMGMLTNLLNPKVALFYVALLPQFVDPSRGGMLGQHLILGATQIAISMTVNFMFILAAGAVATFFARNPFWLAVQRYLMGFVLGGLAVRLAFERR
ncbi:MAG: LysE family translocator [Rhizobiales bacterium]|nr:LysE family translocator [Hyphomicrobiales bacterium]